MSTSNLPAITAYSMANALGTGREASLAALATGRTGLRPCDLSGTDLDTSLGLVDDVDDLHFPAPLASFDCRNNRLALLGLQADGFEAAVRRAVQRHGGDRIGLFLGTSTAGIAETERAYARRRDDDALPADLRFHGTHSLASITGFSAALLGITGPAQTVSTACSSSAKVFGVAQRYLAQGLCDAAVVGGVDSL